MEPVKFTPEEKIKYFDQIAARYYERNFGQVSKADMELLMFHFYLEKMIENCCAEDGTVDYNQCSDFKISKELGITQQRVRNLKVKKQLAFPVEFDWKISLARLTKNARFDPDTHKVTLSIPDPNLYLEIQNFIEEQGAYIEKQLNGKVLQLRAEYYIDLILMMEPEKRREDIIKELRSVFAKEGKDQAKLEGKSIGKSLLDATVNITTVAANISSLISPGNCVGKALMELLLRR